MTATRSITSCAWRKAALAAMTWSVSAAAMAAGYVGTALPTFGGPQTVPNGIDNSGAVTGTSYSASWVQRAFLWKDGTMTDIGAAGATTSTGTESNPAGEVVGALSGNTYSMGFVYSNGVMTPLSWYAFGINAAGDAVGGDYVRAFLYRDGVSTDLGTLGGSSATARAINNAGTIVGYVNNVAGTPMRGFVWKDGVLTLIEPLAGDSTIALDVNDAGEVLGMTSIASDPNAWHVFVWKNGVMTDTGIAAVKGTIPAAGYAINNAGDVLTEGGVLIGGAFTPVANMLPPELAPGSHDGFYWFQPTLTSMNDAGQVVGMINAIDSVNRTGKTVGFVLSPSVLCNN